MKLDTVLLNETRNILIKCIEDVEEDIINKIKDKNNTCRYNLIADLDVIVAVKDKLLARYEYYNPIERTD